MLRTDQSHTICLPCMSQEVLCPVRVFGLLLSQFRGPLDLVINVNRVPLTEAHLRRRLSGVLNMLGLPTQTLTYYSLRRSGASLAFNNNVDFNSIRSQGAWSSDSVWYYLFSTSDRVNEVARMFQRLENSM